MLHKIKTYIEQHHLLKPNGKYIVGLSGGADSVCLLLVLRKLGYHVEPVHCNFLLRPGECDRDEDFCVSLCDSLGLNIHIAHFDTREYAAAHKISIEMAARNLRYDYFGQLRQALGADDIAVAHHANDNVETFLLNVLRGTGLHGLQAIRPRNGHVVRPLLCVSRQEIEQYLEGISQRYVTDSSNLMDDVQRNKLRLNVIPLLKSMTPAAEENILRTIRYASEAVKVLDSSLSRSVEECLRDGIVSIEALQRQPSPEYTLYAILSPCGFSTHQIEQIYASLSAKSGRAWHSKTHTLAKDRECFILGRTQAPLPELHIPMPSLYIYNVNHRLCIDLIERSDDFKPSKEPMEATLDAGKVEFPLTLRPVADGDRFHPYGMNGTKLVSDYLTDRKCNYFQRQRQLVLLDARGNIIWLVGERVSADTAVTDGTIKVLRLRYSKDDKEENNTDVQ